ncbi:hypothetical protein BAUCODRAFT_121492 [Baudoinia panamericana UAMH 10762]|uniref:Uncharacterized protein n=1 Tax=Baudoinia panamericana (strain UAMH 10762) TaxID=717646 RepID=M2NDH5_BAUPA|nr:uncharacterized protein BAUCODRAFT_121492 [Baudoinia panamericana UAMH 10762]EMC96960.1 hypothetical protein BAUCODRAFT_121492 [Baudoinia panamericana UAMH 10762]
MCTSTLRRMNLCREWGSSGRCMTRVAEEGVKIGRTFLRCGSSGSPRRAFLRFNFPCGMI